MEEYPVMTPEFFAFISLLIPRTGDFSEWDMEAIYKAICREVRQKYPDYCTDSESWIKSAHKLFFYDLTKVWTENPTLQTPSRLRAWEWLFDRFSLAIDRAEEESRRRAVAV